MKAPRLPDNEQQRVDTLCRLEILDTIAEERYDRLTRIAQRYYQVQIALVSLVDSDRQWFKSKQGLGADETPRNISFCGHAILDDKIFCIPNALEDPRFVDNPLVTGPPNIRFYAGAPLHANDGQKVGTLCIIDNKPRNFSADEFITLRDLADAVEAEFNHVQLEKIQAKLKRQEDILQLENERLMLATAAGKFGVWEYYIQSKQLEWDDRMLQLYGISRDTFSRNYESWINALHPEDRAQTENALNNSITKGLRFETEFRILLPDNTTRHIRASAKTIPGLDGLPERMIGINFDITEQKSVEQALKHFQSIVRFSNDAVMSLTVDGVYASWNPAAETIFGYLAEEIVGQPMKLLFPHDREAEVTDILETIKNGLKVSHLETHHRQKSGNNIDVMLTISPIFDKQKQVIGATQIVRDIRKRKENETRLKDNESRIRAIVDNVVDGIITIDEQGIVQSLNPAAEQIFGYLESEVVGQNIKMLMPSPYRQNHDGYLKNFKETGDAKVIGIGREVEGQHKSGNIFPMELAVSEMRVKDQTMYTGIVRDISERKKIEKLKSEFVSTVSHELRTPLTSIRGALGLVIGKSDASLPPKVRKMLEMANRNAERLTLLINDILDLEKIESGRLDFKFQTLDINELAQRALEDNLGFAEQHQVELTYHSEVAKALVYGDSHRLLQVFANLLSNAIKYSPENGVVDIKLEATQNSYCISVSDQGAGITDEFRERIFQRFAQADSTDSREKGGTGLGLSICKAIVERHRGSIDYETRLGHGSRFFFYLPVESHDPVSASAHTEHQVLICTENSLLAESLKSIINADGHSSTIVNSTDIASTVFAANPFHLLVLDLNIPQGDGLKLLSKLRENNATTNLPVVVISTNERESDNDYSGHALTVVDWMTKPVDTSRLKKALRSALKKTDRPKILHIEDDWDIIQISRSLFEDSVDFYHASSVKEARQQLAGNHFDLVILDLELTDGSGSEVLASINEQCPIVIFSVNSTAKIVTRQVKAALTKSVTSNQQFKDTILSVLNESASQGNSI